MPPDETVPGTENKSDKKMEAMDAKINSLAETNKLLLNQLSQLNQQIQPKQTKKVADPLEDSDSLIYDNPKEYGRRVKEAAKKEILEEINLSNANQNRQNQTLVQLANDFPELNSRDHALTKKAVEIYGSYDEADKKNPMSYKTAVKEAALELGIQPFHKRSVSDDVDSYSAPSSRANNSGQPRRKNETLDPATLEFARHVGMDVDNPEVVKKLASRQRKNWSKYA